MLGSGQTTPSSYTKEETVINEILQTQIHNTQLQILTVSGWLMTIRLLQKFLPPPWSQKFVQIVRNVVFAAVWRASLWAPRQIGADSLLGHRQNWIHHQTFRGVENSLAQHMLFQTPVRTAKCPSASQSVQLLGKRHFLVSHLTLYTVCGKNLYHLI